MNNQTIELELLASMKFLNANQKDAVLSFVKNINSQNTTKSRNRKNALREIREALKK
tara:strand:- start:624 stop:794 length:171 start_codon:yes stop_codon:yes gene_type:complete